MEVCAFGSLVSHAARRASLTAARIPLASSLVYEPVLTQFTSVTPACFSHVQDPKRFVNTLHYFSTKPGSIETNPALVVEVPTVEYISI